MPNTEHDDSNELDVLIIGAGISGIGSAFHLQQQCPQKTYAILEMQDTFGGTWSTHKYPGVRSDSDLYTYGYRFKPWIGPPIASAQAIRDYMAEVIEENGIAEHIRYGHRVTLCAWDSETNLWTVEATTRPDGVKKRFLARFLWMCQGYYDHENPYVPDWPGLNRYGGRFVHAQRWDPGIDYAGKRVLVIGSGATAATVVPAICETAAHVTMLQRSPTYFFCAKNENPLANRLREVGVDEPTIHRVVRAQVNHDLDTMYRRCVEEPDAVFEDLKARIRRFAGKEDFPFEPHFTPRYRPWQQRVAFCPDGDLFRCFADGKLDVHTGAIETFTATGVELVSGERIDADVVVAATGFNLLMMGGSRFEVDGRPIDWSQTISYRGSLFVGVPNMVWVMGYFRYSWTQRVDLLGDFVCRLLRHMDSIDARRVEVALRDEDAGMELGDWMASEDFSPGYLARAMHRMPRSGAKPEWRHTQNYPAELKDFPQIDFAGDEFRFDGRPAAEIAATRESDAPLARN